MRTETKEKDTENNRNSECRRGDKTAGPTVPALKHLNFFSKNNLRHRSSSSFCDQNSREIKNDDKFRGCGSCKHWCYNKKSMPIRSNHVVFSQ